MFQIFIQTPSLTADSIAIEIPSDAHVNHVFQSLLEQEQPYTIDDYYVTFGGVKIADDQLLCDLGITPDSKLTLMQRTKEDKILSAFKETNIMQKMNWNPQSENCCDDWFIDDIRGIFCDDSKQNVLEIDLRQCGLNGVIDFSKLPKSLKIINLGYNSFTDVDLTKLPDSLEALDLSDNNMECTIDLTKLPPSMKWLSLHGNKLVGTIDLRKLPASMVHLQLTNNRLTGTVDFRKLPLGLNWLGLSGNDFKGYYGEIPTNNVINLDDTVPKLHQSHHTELGLGVVILIVIASIVYVFKCIDLKIKKNEKKRQTPQQVI